MPPITHHKLPFPLDRFDGIGVGVGVGVGVGDGVSEMSETTIGDGVMRRPLINVVCDKGVGVGVGLIEMVCLQVFEKLEYALLLSTTRQEAPNAPMFV